MIGKTVSHYRIIEKLGSGGMGEVFLAEDTKLNRRVALKFLPAHFVSDKTFKTRFITEARAVAKLNHPNIITIHEVSEYAGRPFFAMEYVDGKPLTKIIGTDGLPFDQAIDIALEICEGLKAAHKKDIIHRDIKPNNIIITDDGAVKIVDFGLAKLKGVTKLTKTGLALGTLLYMSPEQALGEKVDNRSDIYSLGAVLYEMITGRPPFQNEYEAAIFCSLVNDTPEPMAKYKADVPDALQRIVDKALERNLEMRYQHVDDLLVDLMNFRCKEETAAFSQPANYTMPLSKVLIPTSLILIIIVLFLIFKPWRIAVEHDRQAIAAENSLAVMYFENLVDVEDQILGNMITNLLITDLAESEYVQVVSYQRLYDILSNMGKEGLRNIDRNVATEVAQKAHVNNMILGSISLLGERKILTSSLVDVSSGIIKKTQKVEGTNIFAMVDQLTREVKNDLTLPEEALAEKDRPVAELSTDSEDAYRHYLRGLDYEYRLLHKEALEQYKKALEYDSTFAMLHYSMRNTYHWLGNEDLATEAWKKALRDSTGAPEKDRMYIRALAFEFESDPQKAEKTYKEIINRYPHEKEAYSGLGFAQEWLKDYSAAIISFERALQLDPNSYWAVVGLCRAHMQLKNHEQAKIISENYVSLQPNDPNARLSLASLYLDLKEYDNALRECQIALELKDDFWLAHLTMGKVFIGMKEYEMARECFKKMENTGGVAQENSSRQAVAISYIYEGRFEAGFKYLKEILKTRKQRGDKGHARDLNRIGRDYLDLNKPDSALEYFEKVKSIAPDYYDGCRVAGIYAIKKDFNRAQDVMDAYMKGLEGETNPVEMTAELNYFKGILEKEKGNYEEAIKYQQKAKEFCLDLYDYFYGFELGTVYLLIGDFTKAEEEFVEQMEDDNPFPIYYIKSHYYLAKAKEGLKQKKEAIEYYKKFLDYWGKADWELPEIGDAKTRLARLKQEMK